MPISWFTYTCIPVTYFYALIHAYLPRYTPLSLTPKCVGIHILDLPTWFCGWGWSCDYHAWRMRLARLAQVINLRPFPICIESTHFFTMSTRCVPCLSDPNQHIRKILIYEFMKENNSLKTNLDLVLDVLLV
jgi:hypothetical protein